MITFFVHMSDGNGGAKVVCIDAMYRTQAMIRAENENRGWWVIEVEQASDTAA